jgi:uncharacterized protein (DUF2344 family)
MNIMKQIPIELKQKVMSYLPILDDNRIILNNIIKNYKKYFIKALLYEYSKYFDDTYYISKYMLEWPHIHEILSRVTTSKDLLIEVFNECTLKETQYLYLFITFRFQSPLS